MHRLIQKQFLPIDLATAWDFFSSPANLPAITPPELGFKIKSDLPEKMYPGMFIKYTVTPLLGIPLEWVTEITHVEEGRFFVDEQRVGPYAIWHHQHHFEEVEGGIHMTDIVDYKLPLGFIGNLFHNSIVKPRLDNIFEFRKKVLEEKFGAVQLVLQD